MVDAIIAMDLAVPWSVASVRPKSAIWAAPAEAKAEAVSRPIPLPFRIRKISKCNAVYKVKIKEEQAGEWEWATRLNWEQWFEERVPHTPPIMTTVLPATLSSGREGEMLS